MSLDSFVRSPFSGKQLRSIRDCTASVNIWDGSIRAGKTLVSLFAWMIFIADAPPTGEVVMIGRTRESIARNIFGVLQDRTLFGDLADQVVYTPGAPTGYILGRRVHVIGASDVKAEKTIRGMTVAGAYVDEVTVIPEEFFTQLLGRMSVKGARLFGTTNPDNPAHWLKRKFLDRIAELPDWRYFQFRMTDNPSLTPEFIAAKHREFTGLWFRRFILGEWVAAEGAVYDMWDPDRHVIRFDAMPPIRRFLGVGIDYGTNHATSAIALGLGYDRRLYLMDELRIDAAQSQHRFTDSEQARLVKQWLPKPHMPEEYGLKPEWMIADQAGASFREELSRDRPGEPPVHTHAADKDVKYGISTIASLLGDDNLRVSDRCQGFITKAPGYSWDPKRVQAGHDEPIKVADDSLDAGRYVVTTLEHQWRSELRTLTPSR